MAFPRKASRRTRKAGQSPRVGLAGLLGAGNLGNDGSMEAILAFLGREYPGAILDFFSTGADELTARYGRPAVRMRWYVPDESESSGRTAVAMRIPKILLGAVVGGVLIGVIQALNDGAPLFLGQKWTQTVMFSILIIMIIFRPGGIFGKHQQEKV